MQNRSSNASQPLTRSSFKRRVVLAGAWSLGGHGLSLALRFGSNLLLTRLLVPEMFGVMAIGMVVITGLTMFSDLGLGQSIVRSGRGNERAFLDTAWTVQVLRGVVLSLCALLIAALLLLAQLFWFRIGHNVYSDPRLPGIIAALSVIALFHGLASTKIALAGRDLMVGRVVQLEVGSQIVGLIGMLAWIRYDRTVWALVVGALLSAMSRTLFSHFALPGILNRWRLDRHSLEEIWGFGKWIFLSSILWFLLSNCDRLLLGGLVDSRTLGIYSIAATIYSLLEQILTRVMGGAVFPALSEIARERADRFQASYYRFHNVIAPMAYVLAGGLMTCGNELVHLLYDHRYAEAGWMLQIIAAGLLATPIQMALQSFLALGMPEVQSRVLIVRVVALVLLLPVGFYFFGLSGALVGVVLSQFSGLPLVIKYGASHGIADLRREARSGLFLLVGVALGEALKLLLSVLF